MSQQLHLPPLGRRLPAWRALVACVAVLAPPPVLAFGDVGVLPACAAFITCSAAVGSSGTWGVREEVSNIGSGFIMPTDLAPGVVVFQGSGTVATAAALTVGRGVGLPVPGATPEFFRAATARAQSDFGVNRVETSMSRGVSGVLTRGSGSASVSLRTFAESSSAWRDVLSFSRSGHFSAVYAVDGRSALGAIGPFDASFNFNPTGTYADWFLDVRVWDVTNLSVSDEFELGGPTPIARARLAGNDEQWAVLDGSAALAFDFAARVS